MTNLLLNFKKLFNNSSIFSWLIVFLINFVVFLNSQLVLLFVIILIFFYFMHVIKALLSDYYKENSIKEFTIFSTPLFEQIKHLKVFKNFNQKLIKLPSTLTTLFFTYKTFIFCPLILDFRNFNKMFLIIKPCLTVQIKKIQPATNFEIPSNLKAFKQFSN